MISEDWRVMLTRGMKTYLRNWIRDRRGVELASDSIAVGFTVRVLNAIMYISEIHIQYKDESLKALLGTLIDVDYQEMCEEGKKLAIQSGQLSPLTFTIKFDEGEEAIADKKTMDQFSKNLARIAEIPEDSFKITLEKEYLPKFRKNKIKSATIEFLDLEASETLNNVIPQTLYNTLVPIIHPGFSKKLSHALKTAIRGAHLKMAHSKTPQEIAGQIGDISTGDVAPVKKNSKKKKKKKKKKSGSGGGGGIMVEDVEEEEDDDEEEVDAEAEVIALALVAQRQQRQRLQRQQQQRMIRQYAPLFEMEQQVFRSRFHDLLARVYQTATITEISLKDARRIFIMALKHKIPSGYVLIEKMNFPLLTRFEAPSEIVMQQFIEELSEMITPETMERLVFRNPLQERKPFQWDKFYEPM
jgi:hypothetical protein